MLSRILVYRCLSMLVSRHKEWYKEKWCGDQPPHHNRYFYWVLNLFILLYRFKNFLINYHNIPISLIQIILFLKLLNWIIYYLLLYPLIFDTPINPDIRWYLKILNPKSFFPGGSIYYRQKILQTEL